MNRNVKAVAILLVIAGVAMVAGYFVWHIYVRRLVTVSCADGPHSTIEPRDFTTRYWTYSMNLEATVAGKAELSTGLDPKMLQQLSEALKETREFSNLVAAGYNSCEITQGQYERYEIHAYAADNLAQEIDSLLSRQSISPDEKTELAGLLISIATWSDGSGQIRALKTNDSNVRFRSLP